MQCNAMRRCTEIARDYLLEHPSHWSTKDDWRSLQKQCHCTVLHLRKKYSTLEDVIRTLMILAFASSRIQTSGRTYCLLVNGFGHSFSAFWACFVHSFPFPPPHRSLSLCLFFYPWWPLRLDLQPLILNLATVEPGFSSGTQTCRPCLVYLSDWIPSPVFKWWINLKIPTFEHWGRTKGRITENPSEKSSNDLMCCATTLIFDLEDIFRNRTLSMWLKHRPPGD